jgi:hypothetical protein
MKFSRFLIATLAASFLTGAAYAEPAQYNALSPFYPAYVAGNLLPSVTVSGAATHVESTAFPGGKDSGFYQIQIANEAATWAFVNFGVVGTLAAATVAASYPVGPGAVVVVTVHPEVTGASVILASSTGNVVFTRGAGL